MPYAAGRTAGLRALWAVVVAAALALVVTSTAQADSADEAWTQERTVLTLESSGELNDVDCTSDVFCMAVGHAEFGADCDTFCEEPWIAHAKTWDGKRWRTTAAANPPLEVGNTLKAVSCATPRFCAAVGSSSMHQLVATGPALLQRWDGHTWQIDTLSETHGDLQDVACLHITLCVAVGNGWFSDVSGPYSLIWDGTSWTTLEMPAPGVNAWAQVRGVSCWSTTACVAVGEMSVATEPGPQRPYLATWDGTAWHQERSPSSSEGDATIDDVTCRSGAMCVAVGSHQSPSGGRKPYMQVWDGSSWRVQRSSDPAPGGSWLEGVSCATSTTCVAVGSRADKDGSWGGRSALALVLRDGRWAAASPPEPAGRSTSTMRSVECRASDSCIAVGWRSDPPHNTDFARSLMAEWDGERWKSPPVADLRLPVRGAEFADLSCAKTTMCMAVGSSETLIGSLAAQAQRWDGQQWHRSLALPRAFHNWSRLSVVSCPTDDWCMALGRVKEAGVVGNLLLRWEGGRWDRPARPRRGVDTRTSLAGLDCSSPTHCFAVGTRAGGTDRRPVVWAWNGIRWAEQVVPPSAASPNGGLTAVDCASGIMCMAVGEHQGDGTQRLLLAYVWDGTGWLERPVGLPTGSTAGELFSVSCPTPVRCVAVGDHSQTSGPLTALVADWHDGRWRLESPDDSETSPLLFTSVSCPSETVCMAVGQPGRPSGSPAWAYDGSHWTPDTIEATYLSAVDCTATACIAVGSKGGQVFTPEEGVLRLPVIGVSYHRSRGAPEAVHD